MEDTTLTSPPGGEILEWAYRVYGDPLLFSSQFSYQLAPLGLFTEKDEEALYLDWQTRDTEVGYRLIAAQQANLAAALTAYGIAMMERRREVALIKVRLDSMEQINNAEPNVELHYSSRVFKALRRDHNKNIREWHYLKRFFFSMGSLDQLMGLAAPHEPRWTRDLEPRFRLLGQAGRGQLRISAFRQRFPYHNYPLPAATSLGSLTGILVAEAAISPSGSSSDILIESDTANYLLHCLHAIALLVRETEQQLRTDGSYQEQGWPVIMVLLRAIIELCYFCNFELPQASSHLLLDPDIPGKLLVYHAESQQWQTIDEPAGERLRRETAQAARLLVTPPSLLNCRQPEEIDKLLKHSRDLPRVNSPKYFEAYLSAGLAQFETGSETSSNRFHVANRFFERLLDRLLEHFPYLQQTFTSAAGGAFQTLTAMALLDARVFNAPALADNDRFRWLARFWKTMGKRRPASILGKSYKREINRILELLGEPPPERSTFLSMQLTTMFKRISGHRVGKDGAVSTAIDHFAELNFTDQVRLISLFNTSWEFADRLLTTLQSAGEPQDYDLVLESLHEQVAKHQPEIAICFNRKWLQAEAPIWQLVRVAAPHAWQFWQIILEKSGWQVMAEQPPEQGLGVLLRAFGDMVRLKMIFEVCYPQAAAQQHVDAEPAARTLLASLSRALMIGGVASDVMAETFSNYYDQTILHDLMVAFAGSLVHYLNVMAADLELNAQNSSFHELLRRVAEYLQLHFPAVESLLAKSSPAPAVAPPVVRLGDETQIEINERGEMLISKQGVVLQLDRAEWLEMMRQLKAGVFAASIENSDNI